MARISTYAKDANITKDDKLFGSNYQGLDNQGRPIFGTVNFKIEDLLVYFSNNIDVGGASFADLSQGIEDLNKLKSFYTFDANGNVTGISTAAAGFIVSSTVSNSYATANFESYVRSKVVQFDAAGNITGISTAFANSIMTTETTTNYASATKLDNVAAKFGSFDGENFNLAQANIQSIFDTYTGLSFANSTYITSIESSVAGKPSVFRQDDEPAIYDAELNQIIPNGSIWYDTNDDNKVYIVNDDPENAGTSAWILTDDSRIGASAEKITNMSASFGSFDENNGFTFSTDSSYFNAVKLYADTNSAAAQKTEKLGAELGVFGTDEAGNLTFSRSLSAGLKEDVSTYVDSDLAVSTKTSNLGAAIGIDEANGGVLQASAQIDNLTVFTTTANAASEQLNTKVFDIAVANTDIEPGQYVTVTGDNGSILSVSDERRVVEVSSTTISLDKEISLANGVEITFTGKSTYNIDNITGVIRDGFAVKGTGITVGTSVSDYTEPELTLSRAEVLADDTALEFLGVYAAVTETSNVLADINGNLKASYGLQVDANGNVAGMKLLADNEGSEISFLADSFKVYNGTDAGVAPFEIVDGKVKIKSANIGTVSFGDLSNIPDYFVITTVYADDGSGTNQSLTRGEYNYYGIYQGQVALQESDLPVTGVTFNQITGDKGDTGDQGVPGDPGTPGLTAYFHVKYSNDNGATFTGNDGEDVGDYIGTYSDNTAADSTDVGDYTWVKILGADGDPGAPGSPGDRVYTTNLFYQTIVTDPEETVSFDTTNLTYDFDTAEFSGIPTGWGTNPPSASPGSGTNALYYVSVNVVEGDPNNVITVGNPTTYLNFNGLVTFTGTGNNTISDGTNEFNYTAIDGAYITTGAIKSVNFTYNDADENEQFIETESVTQGAIFDLVKGYIKTPKLWLTESGNAFFYGQMQVGTGNGAITINDSGISVGSGNFGIDSSGNATFAGALNAASGSFQGDVNILDADEDTVVKIHDGNFVGAQTTTNSATFPNVANLTVDSWDSSYNQSSGGETISSLFNDDYNILYGTPQNITFAAGSYTHTLTTTAITDALLEMSADSYGFARINLGIQFGNSDFSTIYYEHQFPNTNAAPGETLDLPAYSHSTSLVFASSTTVYFRLYLIRYWKINAGSISFTSRTASISSDMVFTGQKGISELSPNGLQILNTDDIYFKVDRENYTSGNPYVDIGGDVKIDGDIEITGNINFSGDVNNSDVTVANLEDRLAEIDSNTYLGTSTGVTFTVRDNLVVSGNLTVTGTTTTINATNLAVSDNMIYLNNDSDSTNLDLGVTGNYNDGTYAHAGVFRDASTGRWTFFDSYTPEPGIEVDITHSTFQYGELAASGLRLFDSSRNALSGFVKANGTVDTNTYATTSAISDFISLTNLSVTSNSASGGGSLSYSDTTGAFTYTPPALVATAGTLTGLTSTIAELNILDGVTANKDEINKLDGVTTTTAQLNYLNTATSNIQTQINNIDPFKYKTLTGITQTSGYTSLFETTVSTKGGVAARAHIRIKKPSSTTRENSIVFDINSSDTGLININASSTSSHIIYYRLIQDTDNKANYIFQIYNPSTDSLNVECFIFDMDKKADIGSGNVKVTGFSSFINSTNHDIHQFVGQRIFAFDTSVSGTTTVDTNLTVNGSITADNINLTIASLGGRTTQTETVLISGPSGTYPGPIEIATLPATTVANARSFLKFTVFGDGEYLEKKYVCDWNPAPLSEWTISVATEESSGKFDVQYDFTNDVFNLVIVDGSDPGSYYGVTVTVDHLGQDIFYDWTYSL
jgi:hypothetical protein